MNRIAVIGYDRTIELLKKGHVVKHLKFSGHVIRNEKNETAAKLRYDTFKRMAYTEHILVFAGKDEQRNSVYNLKADSTPTGVPNTIAMIYEDPITKQKPEGKALLISFISKVEDLEYWWVRFPDDGTRQVQRSIKF